MKTIGVIIVILLFVSSNVFTQDTELSKEEKKALRAQKQEDKIAQGKFMIFPFAGPGYTPEMGGVIFAGGLATFKTNPKDSMILRSSIPFSIGYSTTNAIVGNAILTSFWFKDKLRIYGDFWYKDMPDHYFGVGYENGATVPKSDSTTSYHRKWWWINPRFMFQFRDNFFVGLNVDYNSNLGSEASEGVANDPDYIAYQDKPMNSGLGLLARYDSRDVPEDSREGIYIDLGATFYSTAFGGDNNYQVYLVDYRQFKTVKRAGMTLAWQAKVRAARGEVPYTEMSQPGTPFDLRGYFWGQYRDKGMFFFLAEYRHTFLKNDGSLSKHGAVTWLGSGTVFNRDELVDSNLGWLSNFGVGYRYEIFPRMNIRLDFGIGRETTGIYVNFNQAF